MGNYSRAEEQAIVRLMNAIGPAAKDLQAETGIRPVIRLHPDEEPRRMTVIAAFNISRHRTVSKGTAVLVVYGVTPWAIRRVDLSAAGERQ